MTDEEIKSKRSVQFANEIMSRMKELYVEIDGLQMDEAVVGLLSLARAICDKLQWPADEIWSKVPIPKYKEFDA